MECEYGVVGVCMKMSNIEIACEEKLIGHFPMFSKFNLKNHVNEGLLFIYVLPLLYILIKK